MNYLDERRLDINYSNKYGDTFPLMQNAGKALYDFIAANFSRKKIAIICGTGNNAGDGIACANLLIQEFSVSLLLVKGLEGLKTPESRRAINQYPGKYYGLDDLDTVIASSEIIIDAIFGIGISGEPREPYMTVINKINESGKIVVSIDVPSGFPFDKAIKPDFTVTFTDSKEGMNKSNSGTIKIASIGIPDEIINTAGPGDLIYLIPPDKNSHKGMNGVAGIIAGMAYPGAAIMSSLGASRTGIDLVKLYTKKENFTIAGSYDPGIMLMDINNIDMNEINRCNSILLGPGAGIHQEYEKLFKSVISGYSGNIIVDADALKLLKPDDLKNKNAIITPHKMEFKIFTGMDASEENAKIFSGKYNIITVLKGNIDIITDGGHTVYSYGGNARMTMGGTGDVLAGVITGISTKKIPLFRSAVIGSYINKKAGELSYNQYGYYYNIMDMVKNITSAVNNEN
ncbi:MAG: NAD(P)H-hydrate dehydratase [Ferroplasma sp.]